MDGKPAGMTANVPHGTIKFSRKEELCVAKIVAIANQKGGVGTLIASLASLITFREYVKHNPGKSGAYVKEFSLFNFSFLILLTGFMLLLKTAAQHGS